MNAHYGKQREGKLEPFRDEVFSLRVEGHTYREIYMRIQKTGYQGTMAAIRVFMSKKKRIQRDLQVLTGGEPQKYIDKKWLIRILYQPLEKIKGISEAQLAAVFTNCPLAVKVIGAVREFKAALKSKNPEELLAWMEKATSLQIARFDTFVAGLKHDITLC